MSKADMVVVPMLVLVQVQEMVQGLILEQELGQEMVRVQVEVQMDYYTQSE